MNYCTKMISRNSWIIAREKKQDILKDVNPFFAELAQDSLTFRDEIDLDELNNGKRLRLHLVDHNKLFNDPQLEDAGAYVSRIVVRFYGGWASFSIDSSVLTLSVVEVIDHHKDERSAQCSCRSKIEMVGSCCTLVTEAILKESPDFLTSDSAVVPLLLGTLLLDTVNLSEQAGRTTPKDLAMVQRLHALRPHLDLNVVFGNLQKAKFDVSALSTVDLLRKGYYSQASI